MPRTPEQYQQIRDDKIRLIMDSALELFANKGYHSTSISEIAKHAGISKGLLYNYFSGKEELVVTVMKDGFLELVSYFDPNHDHTITRDVMKYFITNVLKSIEERSHFWRLYFAVISQPIVNEAAFGEIMEIALPMFAMLSAYFEKMGYENPEAESRFFTALMDGITLNHIYDPGNFPIYQIETRLLKMYNLLD